LKQEETGGTGRLGKRDSGKETGLKKGGGYKMDGNDQFSGNLTCHTV